MIVVRMVVLDDVSEMKDGKDFIPSCRYGLPLRFP